MTNWRRWTDRDIEQLKKLVERDLIGAEIAARLDRTTAAVYQRMSSLGIRTKHGKNQFFGSEREMFGKQLRADYEAGRSIYELSKETGHGVGTVYRMLVSAGAEMRRRDTARYRDVGPPGR